MEVTEEYWEQHQHLLMLRQEMVVDPLDTACRISLKIR